MADRAAAPSDGDLPPIATVEDVRRRLAAVFPESFADRSVLVGVMAARVVFVFLYGGFIEGTAFRLRPSLVYLFTSRQAQKRSPQERAQWRRQALKPGFRPVGTRWYADNSRESIRDDLMRNRLLSMGLIGRVEGVATTSSAPVYYLSAAFAALFDPALCGSAFDEAVKAWRAAHLTPASLQRMALRAHGALAREGDVYIELPDGSRARIAAGPSAPILKAMVEQFAPRWLRQASVLWLSASDQKSYPQFVQLAARVGLRFDLNSELPDLILADLADPVRFLFCEVVATDGPVTADRKAALLAIAEASGIDPANVHFVSAFQDREAGAFRKTFSRIAHDSDI